MSKPKGKAMTPSPKRRHSTWTLVIAGATVLSVLIAIAVAAEPDANPTTGNRDPAIVAEGATLFAANCAVCHGADLLGTAAGPPFLHVFYAPNHHSDEAFQRAVAFGVIAHHWDFGDMAPLAHLSRAKVAEIVAFVRTEQQAAGILDRSH